MAGPRLVGHGVGPGLPPGIKAMREFLVCKRQDAGCHKACIDGAGLADGQRSHGDAGRHLDDGQQAVLSGQGLGFNRNAENRQRGEGSGHAGKVGSAAGAGDDHLEAFGTGILGKGNQSIRCPVSRHNQRLVADAELVEYVARVFHGRPIGLTAHDDGDLG
jgi:hypothetical protein